MQKEVDVVEEWREDVGKQAKYSASDAGRRNYRSTRAALDRNNVENWRNGYRRRFGVVTKAINCIVAEEATRQIE